MKVISLCLSDLPKGKITEGSNGKKYISLVVDNRREKDKFGNDVTVYVNQTKEEREAKTDKVYVGNGKTYTFENKQQTSAPVKATSRYDDDSEDSLPF